MKRLIAVAIVCCTLPSVAEAQFVPRQLTIIGGGCSNNPWVGASSNIYGDMLRGHGLYQMGQAARMQAAARLLEVRARIYYAEQERRQAWNRYRSDIRRQKREAAAAQSLARREARRRDKAEQERLEAERAEWEEQIAAAATQERPERTPVVAYVSFRPRRNTSSTTSPGPTSTMFTSK